MWQSSKKRTIPTLGKSGALRNRGSCGARMIALENGDLAPTPFAGRQRWQRHFAKLLCGEILPSSVLLLRGRITMRVKMWNLKRTFFPR